MQINRSTLYIVTAINILIELFKYFFYQSFFVLPTFKEQNSAIA